MLKGNSTGTSNMIVEFFSPLQSLSRQSFGEMFLRISDASLQVHEHVHES